MSAELTRAQTRGLAVLYAAGAAWRSNQTDRGGGPLPTLIHTGVADALIRRGFADGAPGDGRRVVILAAGRHHIEGIRAERDAPATTEQGADR